MKLFDCCIFFVYCFLKLHRLFFEIITLRLQLLNFDVSAHKEFAFFSKHFESLKFRNNALHVTFVTLDEVLFFSCHRLSKHRVYLLNLAFKLEKDFVVGLCRCFILVLFVVRALQSFNLLIPLLLSLLTLLLALVMKPLSRVVWHLTRGTSATLMRNL